MSFLKQDAHLDAMIQGLIRQQTVCVLIDPYANAFNMNTASPGDHQDDDTTKISRLHSRIGVRIKAMNRHIYERKFEIDSLCAFLKLANVYFSEVGHVRDGPFNGQFVSAVEAVYKVFLLQQGPQKEQEYTFARRTTVPTDTLAFTTGPPFRPTGMVSV